MARRHTPGAGKKGKRKTNRGWKPEKTPVRADSRVVAQESVATYSRPVRSVISRMEQSQAVWVSQSAETQQSLNAKRRLRDLYHDDALGLIHFHGRGD